MIYCVKYFALHPFWKVITKMFEKNLKQVCLLDFYGNVLSDRKQEALSMYYNDDMSLAEIAEEMGISRQGVRDLIKKGEEELEMLEEKLGVVKRFDELSKHLERLLSAAESNDLPREVLDEIARIKSLI